MADCPTVKRGASRPTPPRSAHRFAFNRDHLPQPAEFYAGEGINLEGCGAWRSALCPFHKDKNPSMRVFFNTGAFRCMVCGSKGGDVLAFYMLRHSLRFIDAAKALGAWKAAK